MKIDRPLLILVVVAISSFCGGIVGGSLVGPALASAGDTTPKKLTVQDIDLVDASGNLVARLGENEFQVPGLFLYDTSGHDMIQIDVGPHSDSPQIVLFEKDGWPAVGLHVEPAGSGLRGLYVSDKDAGGIRLETSKTDAYGLKLSSGFSNRASLLLDSSGHPSLEFDDERGQPVKRYP